MSVLSAASTTYITRIAIVKLRKAVLFECEIEVKRSGKIQVMTVNFIDVRIYAQKVKTFSYKFILFISNHYL